MSENRTERSTGPEPVTHTLVETIDPERAHHLIARNFGHHRAQISGPRRRFYYRRRSLLADELAMDTMRYTLSARAETPPYPGFAAVTLTRGRYAIVGRQEGLRLSPGTVGRYPESPSTLIAEDVAARIVRLPVPRIAAVAALRTGLPSADFRFITMTPVSPAMAALWQSVTAFVHRELTEDDAAIHSPLVRAGLVNLIAATAVAVFPNTTMTGLYLPSPRSIRSAVVRRATDFIEAHAAEPLTVVQIAAACDVGPRALQVAFQRHHGQSPMGLLRAVRLRRAHHDLENAKPGQTVTEMARRWGFAHTGRFAQAYRKEYGCLPGDTLRQTAL
ncbi:helix-turn-helix transcriptional regulator [Micromonospora carbonacea]|nr:helix-turn-helix transcriptional regulator [Micromonospora carbonacea]